MSRAHRRARGRTRPGRGGRVAAAQGQLRIIAGQWRGRRLPVAELPGLRPTGDRVRETLFNWLQPELPGARCLDMFAGTGALGLEALSRGAAHCDFFDTQRPAIDALYRAIEQLGAGDRAAVYAGDALALESGETPWDIVFLDPPFDADIADAAIDRLLATAALAPGALLYVEHPAQRPATPGDAFESLRRQRAGAVAYGLYRFTGQTA